MHSVDPRDSFRDGLGEKRRKIRHSLRIGRSPQLVTRSAFFPLSFCLPHSRKLNELRVLAPRGLLQALASQQVPRAIMRRPAEWAAAGRGSIACQLPASPCWGSGGWACTSHPGVLGSIPKREEPGKTGRHPALKYRVPHGSHPSFTQYPSSPRPLERDGQTSSHWPRLVVSRSTCPHLSPSPPPREQLCNRYCSNKHTPVLQ